MVRVGMVWAYPETRKAPHAGEGLPFSAAGHGAGAETSGSAPAGGQRPGSEWMGVHSVCRGPVGGSHPGKACIDSALREMGLPASTVSCRSFAAADERPEQFGHVAVLRIADGGSGHDPAPGVRPPTIECSTCGRPRIDEQNWSPRLRSMQKRDLFVGGESDADLFCRPSFRGLYEADGLTGLRFLPFRGGYPSFGSNPTTGAAGALGLAGTVGAPRVSSTTACCSTFRSATGSTSRSSVQPRTPMDGLRST